MIFLNTAVISCCIAIAYQDVKSRMVYWFLFPILGILLAILHIQQLGINEFMAYALMNSMIISLVIFILFIVSRTIFNRKFLNTSMGLGDLLFFYALGLGFPTLSFLWLFVSATLFALLVYLASKRLTPIKTVPLAGLMGIYLIMILTVQLLFETPSLYQF